MPGRSLESIVLPALLLLVGCSGAGDDPHAVAEKFWGAMQARDVEAARQYVTADTRESLSVKEKGSEDEEVTVEFGETTKEEDHVAIETTLTSKSGDSQMTIPMQTVLVQEEGAWRVDAERTMMSIFGGAMEAMMEGMADAMKESMEGMGEAMAEGMKEGMEGMASEMEKQNEAD